MANDNETAIVGGPAPKLHMELRQVSAAPIAVCVLAFLLGGVPPPAFSEDAAEKVASASSATAAQGDPEAGKQIFRGRCSRCHFATSTKDRLGPGLKGVFQQETMTRTGLPAIDENVRKLILEGSRAMPPFREALTHDEIDNLIAFLKTL